MSRVRYGVQVEFTVDDIIAGGPSKAEVRRFLRAAITNQQDTTGRFSSLSDVGIKYLHEASTATNNAIKLAVTKGKAR